MFVMDVPPDVPPQYAPIVVAQASQAKQQSRERTFGVCQLIDSRPEERLSAVNSLGPVASAWGYLKGKEKVPLTDADYYAAKMTLLQAPKHGVLELDVPTQSAGYTPTVPNFEGSDQATFLVEVGGYKVKLIYFIKILGTGVGGGSDQGTPYDDKQNCPKGDMWKISFNENDPNAPIYSFEHPYTYTSALSGYATVNLTFADLPGTAVGETTGNTITLDINAAGHNWLSMLSLRHLSP